jgi:hypothetical protein
MIELKLKQRAPDETADIHATGALIACSTCAPLLGPDYPLWDVHLHAAVALHAAHRAVADLRSVPALTDDDRLFGRRLVISAP